MPRDWLRDALALNEDETPFPWQEDLLARFRRGDVPRALDIPTGLGKTAVIAIWLVARAEGAPLPRRLVYIVDRRAVVDQATDVAETLRQFVDRHPDFKERLGLAGRALPISTLRGQHVDNREWLDDPASPAIIVGTVDMIGSRLLFEGYSVSRKMRPFHAGLLGVDALVVVDEAHLVPPFEHLLRTVADEAVFRSREPELQRVIPAFKLLVMTATGRAPSGDVVRLTTKDEQHPVLIRRLRARKQLQMLRLDHEAKLENELARNAWAFSDNANAPIRCIVFSHKREVAENAKKVLERLASGDKNSGQPRVEIDTELFVGGRRVFEREHAKQRLKDLGFIAGSKVELTRPVFLFATSAGEVGVDLDADHMVSDLVAWERMVQRLGRVNRRGDGAARVIVLVEAAPKPNKKEQAALTKRQNDESLEERELDMIGKYEARLQERKNWQEPLLRLPKLGEVADASPGALCALKDDSNRDLELRRMLDAAVTPEPLRPALTRPLVDAWSMTSLKEHTGRPEVHPWLRGWVDELPQTSIVWRRYLPVRENGSLPTRKELEAFFEAAPPLAIETLETEAYRGVALLMARAAAVANRLERSDRSGEIQPLAPLRLTDVAVIPLTPAGDQRERPLLLADLLNEDVLEDALRRASPAERARLAALRRKEENLRRETTKDALERIAAGATLVIDRRLGGLGPTGLIDEEIDEPPTTVDDEARSLCPIDDGVPRVHFRVWSTAEVTPDPKPGWRPRFCLALDEAEEGEGTYLVVEKWRHDAATEEDRSAAGRPQLVDEHEEWAEKRARTIAKQLGLDQYADMLGVTARVHDEGKRARRWQRAFSAPGDGDYAKTKCRSINYDLLDGYRHELGSLLYAITDEHVRALGDEQRELALHLIVAHHGFARPVIRTTGCDNAPPSALEERAREIALRFARLQKRWGPWGLAWWESLLRAADQQASRQNDEREA